MMNIDDIDDILYVIGKQCEYNSLKKFRGVSKKLYVICCKLLKELYNDYYNKLKLIKDLFPSKMDQKFDEYKKYINIKMNFIEFRTIKLNDYMNYINDRRYLIPFNINKSCFIKNIRLSDQTMIEYIDLLIHGASSDLRIYNLDNGFEIIRKILKINDNEIIPLPGTCGMSYCMNNIYSDIKIIIKFNDLYEKLSSDVYISYELWSCDELDINNCNVFYAYYGNIQSTSIKVQYLTHTINFTGEDPIYGKLNRYKLNYNYPMNYIFMTFMGLEPKINRMGIIFNGRFEFEPLADKINNYYVISLVKSMEVDNIKKYSIDYCYIDHILLYIYLDNDLNEINEECKIYIYGLATIPFGIETQSYRNFI